MSNGARAPTAPAAPSPARPVPHNPAPPQKQTRGSLGFLLNLSDGAGLVLESSGKEVRATREVSFLKLVGLEKDAHHRRLHSGMVKPLKQEGITLKTRMYPPERTSTNPQTAQQPGPRARHPLGLRPGRGGRETTLTMRGKVFSSTFLPADLILSVPRAGFLLRYICLTHLTRVIPKSV